MDLLLDHWRMVVTQCIWITGGDGSYPVDVSRVKVTSDRRDGVPTKRVWQTALYELVTPLKECDSVVAGYVFLPVV